MVKNMTLKNIFAYVLTVALFLGGSGFTQITAAQQAAADSQAVRVIQEQGPSGHTTIGIDESTIAAEPGKESPLTFSTLMTWEFDPNGNSAAPEAIKQLDGRRVTITGFMFPLQQGASLEYFCLLRTTQTCCYGPRPQYNQYVFVEMKEPTTFHRLDPVSCAGTFHVDPTPEEGFIYRMEGLRCEIQSKK